ncbi:MAG: tyrosine-type recombinase/integrase [Endomicrobium sp.]|jgi:integrase/recombinase XerC|nr:tyrosine-type recombinase/integrase [Endomicrobium sp.]
MPLCLPLEKFLLSLPRHKHNYILADPDGKRYAPYNIRIKLRQIFNHCGFTKNISLHKIRHTFATHLAQYGVRLDNIKDLLGHSSTAMTNKYRHMTPDFLKDTVSLLPDFVSPKEKLPCAADTQGS